MSKPPAERAVRHMSPAKTEWLTKPSGRSQLTPRRRVVSETTLAGGLRILQLECGHSCGTRMQAVIETTPCLLCGEAVP